jgi:DNA-binding transcriptional MerR regulator
MIDSYSRSEVEKMIDVTKGRVRFYVDQGVIPDFIPAKGRGFNRRYSKREVFILATAAEMSRSGIALDNTKRLIKFLTENEKTLLDINEYQDNNKQHEFWLQLSNSITCVINFNFIYSSIKWILV